MKFGQIGLVIRCVFVFVIKKYRVAMMITVGILIQCESVSPLVMMEQKIKVTQIEAMAVRVKPNGHVKLIDA